MDIQKIKPLINAKTIVVMILLLLSFSCEELVYDNPLDPDNPDFIEPETTILSGPAEGETVNSSSVPFTWEGNEQATEYSYSMDGGPWSDWSTETSVTVDYLDEDSYLFQVKSRYPTEDEDTTPAEVEFTVDAVHGPALRVFPLLIQTSVGQPIATEVFMEEVDNIMVSEFSVTYNPLLVSVQSIRKGDLLDYFSGESVLIYETTQANGMATITFNVGVAVGDNPGLTGTGSVAIIDFLPVSIGEFDVEIAQEATFRDYNNLEIPVNQIVNGRVEVD